MAKFNANSLSYSSDLPPFLAALKDQYADHHGIRDGGPDPILAARRRAVKKRSASEEAEDAPLVLDDRGDVVAGVTFGKDGTAKQMDTSKEPNEAANAGEDREKSEKSDGVAFGAGKKKRVGRIVGGNEGEETREDKERKRKRTAEEEKHEKHEKSGAKEKDLKDVSSSGKAVKVAALKKKKKAKIQLSFEDDDEDAG